MLQGNSLLVHAKLLSIFRFWHSFLLWLLMEVVLKGFGQNSGPSKTSFTWRNRPAGKKKDDFPQFPGSRYVQNEVANGAWSQIKSSKSFYVGGTEHWNTTLQATLLCLAVFVISKSNLCSWRQACKSSRKSSQWKLQVRNERRCKNILSRTFLYLT